MVLKYTSPRRKGKHHDGEYPEPIFFEPSNERIGAKTFEDSIPFGGGWRSEPFNDSWSMKYNPDRKKTVKGMPSGPRYGFYSTMYVTMATPEEAQEFYKLKAAAYEKDSVNNVR